MQVVLYNGHKMVVVIVVVGGSGMTFTTKVLTIMACSVQRMFFDRDQMYCQLSLLCAASHLQTCNK